MLDEKCPNCGSDDYEVENYWDDFDEDGGVRTWDCICSSCHKEFSIMYEYKYLNKVVEVSEES